ncbi:hypothetical protein, variant 2 [Cryptococcus amylolentus CBS 6039]|nr:hypothetical protein, variant 2 [Cryptococcus amylolentus CBS 6039]ODN84927.1 hypothetical protein, variant 2 [Cryptococcus amylolentus CBS 6039]
MTHFDLLQLPVAYHLFHLILLTLLTPYPSTMPRRLLYSFAQFYNSNFERRPTATLIVTNGVLNSVADILAQSSSILLHKPTVQNPLPPTYDPARTLRFAVFGMAMGPIIGRWMRLLEKRIPMPNVSRGGGLTLPGEVVRKKGGEGVQLAKRVLADQVVMAPIGLCLFVGSMGIMEGHSQLEISEKFRDIYWAALFANWKIWPLIQTINFKLMPIQYRVPFQSTCGIAWTLYLSLLNAQ